MYMQSIEMPVRVSREEGPAALTLAAGLAFILLSALVMVPYLLAFALWAAIGLAIVGVKATAVEAFRSVTYAGELLLGR